MAPRCTPALRPSLRSLIVLLRAGLILWVAVAPLIWILRDGLGPDMVESGWAGGAFKFLAGWGAPALALALPLLGLSLADRRPARAAPVGPQVESHGHTD